MSAARSMTTCAQLSLFPPPGPHATRVSLLPLRSRQNVAHSAGTDRRSTRAACRRRSPNSRCRRRRSGLSTVCRGRLRGGGWRARCRRRRSCTQSSRASPAACRCRRCPAMYGSAPICSHRSRNSCVPKAFVSTTWPQWMLTRLRPLGRIADAVAPVIVVGKAAAGPAEVGNLDRLRSAATTSLRMPRVLGIVRVGPDPDAVVDATRPDARRSGRRCCG